MIVAAWALAAAAQDCTDAEITATIPAEGTTVPTDTPVAFEYDGCRETAQDLHVSVQDGDGVVVQEWYWSWAPTEPSGFEIYDLDAPLLPDAAHTLVFERSDGPTLEIPFTTGSGEATALSGAPTLTFDADPEYQSFADATRVELRIAPVADASRTSYLELRDGDGEVHYTGILPAPPNNVRTLVMDWPSGSAPDEICAQAVQIDATGAELSSALECRAVVDPSEGDGGCGCATGTPAGAWPFALLLVTARRRRASGNAA